ncbi:MAG: ATP-binding cassette domain-containing protein [Lachnospiraceae bacterium]|jgi:ABC-2 type transport system ATP-binding protein|nr:ATP-binding cassette domain-containing protein [Lachnospiraceae bacterium]
MKLEVKQLRKNFGEIEVLHGISFAVESGKALGLLGRNGAGKTTTIRIIMNVFKNNGGEVLLDGKPFHSREQPIGYLPEERGMYPRKKILEQMVYFASLRGMETKQAKERGRYWLKRLEIEEYENRKLETLSKGNQQKVQLAQALIHDPQIVILDEPFSGLDPVNSQILKDVVIDLIKENKLVIFSSHQMSYVEEFCEEVAIINHGEIVLDGNLKQIKREYGKDRLILSSDNWNLNELHEKLKEDFSRLVKVEQKKRDFLILSLLPQVTKEEFLKGLLEKKIEIQTFGNYEPSLQDIFVQKAGEED